MKSKIHTVEENRDANRQIACLVARGKMHEQRFIDDDIKSEDIIWDKTYNDRFKTYNKEEIQTVGPILLPWER